MKTLRKIMAISAIFCLYTVSATTPNRNLSTAINEFNFVVTVEWNQENQEVYDQALTKFQLKLLKMLSEGVSKEEVVNSVIRNIKNEKVANEVRDIINTVDVEKLSKVEVVSLVSERLESTQVSGAQFVGRASTQKALIIGLVIALVAVIAIGVNAYLNEREEREEAEAEVERLRRELLESQAARAELERQLVAAQGRIDSLLERILELEEGIDNQSYTILELTHEIDMLRLEVGSLEAQLSNNLGMTADLYSYARANLGSLLNFAQEQYDIYWATFQNGDRDSGIAAYHWDWAIQEIDNAISNLNSYCLTNLSGVVCK